MDKTALEGIPGHERKRQEVRTSGFVLSSEAQVYFFRIGHLRADQYGSGLCSRFATDC